MSDYPHDPDRKDADMLHAVPHDPADAGPSRPPGHAEHSEASPSQAGMHEMDPEIAEYWDLWSAQIGQAVFPQLKELSGRLLGLTSAMVCTSDGFNLCSIGLDEAQVARLSALASSLYSVSGAASQVAQAADANVEILDMVSLHQGASQTVIVSVSGLVIGNLLLWLTAEDETLGVMLVAAKAAAKELYTLLAVEP